MMERIDLEKRLTKMKLANPNHPFWSHIFNYVNCVVDGDEILIEKLPTEKSDILWVDSLKKQYNLKLVNFISDSMAEGGIAILRFIIDSSYDYKFSQKTVDILRQANLFVFKYVEFPSHTISFSLSQPREVMLIIGKLNSDGISADLSYLNVAGIYGGNFLIEKAKLSDEAKYVVCGKEFWNNGSPAILY